MPLPMVHLAVSHRLTVEHGFPYTGDFFLGSIAPDAVHSRKNWDREDKRKSHFFGETDWKLDMARIRNFLAESGLAAVDREFAKGYAVHLLTDRIWKQTVFDPFRRTVRNEGRESEESELYYRDCDRLDFDLFDRSDWRPEVWRMLAGTTPRDLKPLLSTADITAWRDRTLGWYDLNPSKRGHTPAHITLAEVEAFITDAMNVIPEEFRTFHSK